MTKEEQIALAIECGFSPYDPTNLSGDNDLDESISVGEYPVGVILNGYTTAVEAKERERLSEWIRSQRNDIPATGEEFANAIRSIE